MKIKHLAIPVAVGVAFVTWSAIILLSGWGVNATGVEWNFERIGQLGDSYGVLSSGMASIAAYFAFQTYQTSLKEGAENSKRAVETAFLNLSERRFDVLAHVAFESTVLIGFDSRSKTTNGQAALEIIAGRMQGHRRSNDLTLEQIYKRSVDGISGVPSFLRFTYHIVALVDREFDNRPNERIAHKGSVAYRLVRLLRAQMSDSELLLIALNCVVGKGYGKFKPLVEKYALLHNLPHSDRVLFDLDEFFFKNAFGLTEEDRDVSDDIPPQAWLDAMLPENR